MRGRYRKLLLLGAWSLAVPVGSTAVHVGSAGAVTGGRLTLVAPTRILDTRGSGRVTGPVAIGTFAQVTITGATADGDAFLSPCAGTPGDPIVSYSAGEIVHLPVVSSDSLCLTTTTPVDVVVDRYGDTSAAATPGGLQYVPLTAPRVLSQGLRDASTPTGELEQLDLTGVPAEARAAVVLVESYDLDGDGQVTSSLVGLCPGAHSGATANSPGPGLSVGYIPITTPTASICAWYTGGPFARVTLLGYLSTDGPDPTRLPPTLGATLVDALPPGLAPITPTRVLDTREAIGVATTTKVPAGETVVLDLGAQSTAETTGAVLNLAVTEPGSDGFVTVYPCDAPRPTAANINFVAGETVSNLVTVKLAVDATVCLYTFSTTHLVADLTATYELFSGAGVEPVVPARLLDTRDGTGAPTGKLGAGQVLVLDVGGRGGTPDTGVDAVTLNLAVTEPEGPGFITAWPCDADRPTAANLNYVAGQTVPNAVTVGVSAAGTVCLFTYARTHLIADVSAWFGLSNTDGFDALVPDRLLDTRIPIGTSIARTIPAGGTLTLQVAGRGGVPEDVASAVVMNLAVTEPRLDGFLTVYPCDEGRPLAANLNYDRDETVSNQVTAKLSADGTVCIYAQRQTHVVADVAGFFSSELTTYEIFDLVE